MNKTRVISPSPVEVKLLDPRENIKGINRDTPETSQLNCKAARLSCSNYVPSMTTLSRMSTWYWILPYRDAFLDSDRLTYGWLRTWETFEQRVVALILEHTLCEERCVTVFPVWRCALQGHTERAMEFGIHCLHCMNKLVRLVQKYDQVGDFVVKRREDTFDHNTDAWLSMTQDTIASHRWSITLDGSAKLFEDTCILNTSTRHGKWIQS